MSRTIAIVGSGGRLGAALLREWRTGGEQVIGFNRELLDLGNLSCMREELEPLDFDVLVNCAGGDIGAKGGKPNPNNALDIELDDIRVLTENNLIGTMLVCQAFVPPMVAAGSGSVVNIASAAAHMGCSPEVVYSTLKAAVRPAKARV